MTTRHPEKPFAASALALEVAAVALLCAPSSLGPARALGAAVAHALGAAAFAAFLARRARRFGLEGTGRAAWLLLGLVAAVLPLAGPAALAVLIGRLARAQALPEAALASAPLTPLSALAPAADASVGTGRGSLEARLRFDPDAASRVAALLATRRLATPSDAVRLVKLALRDKHEDVRLLAHALLEDRDRQAFRSIEALERALAAAPVERRPPIETLLAEALCDLCDSGLVSGELESFTLRRARALIDAAPSAGAPRASASAALVLGRVLLREGDGGAARTAFEDSRRLGAAPAGLAPLLAEAAFVSRKGGAPA